MRYMCMGVKFIHIHSQKYHPGINKDKWEKTNKIKGNDDENGK